MRAAFSFPLRQAMRPLARFVLDRVPLVVWQNLFPKDVIGVMYHVVADRDLPHMRFYEYKSCDLFEQDVLFAKDRYKLVTFEQLHRQRTCGHRTPHNQVLLTFDDGFAECFTNVRPILLRHQVSGMFFVTTDFIDNQTMFFESKISLCLGAIERLDREHASALLEELSLSSGLPNELARHKSSSGLFRWTRTRLSNDVSQAHSTLINRLAQLQPLNEQTIDQLCEGLGVDANGYLKVERPYLTGEQIQQLVADGFTVGAHGRTHHNMSRLGPRELEEEIVSSCKVIQDLTGQPMVPFAFPYAGSGVERRLLADILSRHHFIGLFFDTGGLAYDMEYVVNRVWADSPEGSREGESNLPFLLRRAWSLRSAWPARP